MGCMYDLPCRNGTRKERLDSFTHKNTHTSLPFCVHCGMWYGGVGGGGGKKRKHQAQPTGVRRAETALVA